MSAGAVFAMFHLLSNSTRRRRPTLALDQGTLWLFQMGLLASVACLCSVSLAHDDGNPFGKGGEQEESAITGNGGGSSAAMGATPCTNGFAGPYPCSGINLFSFLPLSSIGGGNGNDIWGWTSPAGNDYAIYGQTDGTRFIDVTVPTSPVYLGNLSRTSGAVTSVWRDMKVYANHAYIVADGSAHGMQVFDLTQLDAVDRNGGPVTFSETAHYSGFSNAHNIVINEDTGFAYAVGTNTYAGGLHAVNLQNPAAPVHAGGFSGDGYTHDAQAVIYHGPDQDFVGKEIVFASNEETVTIVDVTNKGSQQTIARANYLNTNYIHQGWLTEDHRYFLQNDELDEKNSASVKNTRTHVWDVKDLSDPVYLGFYGGETTAIDHNLYTYDGLAYEANYAAGLRVLDLKDVRNADLSEVGYFDIVPQTNAASFNGAWSVFKFEDSGTVIVNGREQGLFVLDTEGIVAGSGLQAGTPTSGVLNASFENTLGPNGALTLVDDQRLSFSGALSGSSIVDGMIPGWSVIEGGTDLAFVNNVREAQFIGGGGDSTNGDFSSNDAPGVGVPDGLNSLALSNFTGRTVALSVLSDLLESDTLYELTVYVGQAEASPENAGYDISLYAGDVELGRIRNTDLGAPEIPIGTFSLVSLDIDSRDFDLALGLPLEIRLATESSAPVGYWTHFDLVNLELTSLNAPSEFAGVPEPSSVILLLMGIAVARAARRRRMRRSSAN